MPSSFSYRHPRSGEWAHNLSANIDDDVRNTYIEPIWDELLAKGSSHLRILEVGFGRGYNCAELIHRCQQNPGMQMSIVGLEPCPDILQPWPAAPENWIMPWWANNETHYADPAQGWELEIRALPAQHPQAFAGGPYDAIIVDLFSLKQHPEHWADPFIANMSAAVAPKALLSSYSCARVFRDKLSNCGWRPQVLRREDWRDTLVAVFDG
ncbi:MAG: tRNA U34 5-methylaminomethyl-2-thiouridine-forming methyltransferase MnmC [Myxococcota bacterium]